MTAGLPVRTLTHSDPLSHALAEVQRRPTNPALQPAVSPAVAAHVPRTLGQNETALVDPRRSRRCAWRS